MSNIIHYEANAIGSDFVISDVHGGIKSLEYQLKRHNYNKETDRLFFVGDLINKGKNSNEVIDFVIEHNGHSVLGNHENYLRHACENNINDAMLNWFYHLHSEQQSKIMQLIQSMPLGITIDTTDGLVGVVHADVPFNDFDLFKNSEVDEKLIFTTLESRAGHDACEFFENWHYNKTEDNIIKGVDLVVSGHTPEREIRIHGNRAFIDVVGSKVNVLQIQPSIGSVF
jgi:serine/threonine protein phosphatase 1